MLALAAAAPTAFAGPPAVAAPRACPQMAAIDDLKVIAKEQNPVIGFWDPLNLCDLNFWGQGDDATVGFLRHAEIKHGRVAMAAFVGFLVQANGVKFPWAPFNSITAESPCDQWDALPEAAKLQIIGFVGFLEVFSEHSYILEAQVRATHRARAPRHRAPRHRAPRRRDAGRFPPTRGNQERARLTAARARSRLAPSQGQKHYMRGGKPGYFPSLKEGFGVHPVPFNLFGARARAAAPRPRAAARRAADASRAAWRCAPCAAHG